MKEDPFLTRRMAFYLYAGLAFAIVGNVALIAANIGWGNAYMIPGNVVVVIICTAAMFLVRWRRRNPR